MFDSCIETFIAGCYAPDTTGTCTDANDVTSWSDGHRYEQMGSAPGLYGPNDTMPCVSIVINGGDIVATRGTETLKYVADTSTDTGEITCPDGSTFTASFNQVSAFNECLGLSCPD